MSTADKRDPNLVSLLWASHEMAPDIAAIHGTLFESAWDRGGIMKLLEHPGSTALIARTGFPKVSVGFAMAQMVADEAEILSVGVVKDWQRVGLGFKLADGIERALRRAGVKNVFLEVAEDNTAARALYAKMGFSETRRRKGYYARKAGPAIDALVLGKVL